MLRDRGRAAAARSPGSEADGGRVGAAAGSRRESVARRAGAAGRAAASSASRQASRRVERLVARGRPGRGRSAGRPGAAGAVLVRRTRRGPRGRPRRRGPPPRAGPASRRDPPGRRRGDRVQAQVVGPGDGLGELGAAAPIMAALSVQSGRSGTARRRPWRSAPSATSSRRRPLAATPPPSATAGHAVRGRGRDQPVGQRPHARPPDRRRRGRRARARRAAPSSRTA